MAEAPSEMCKIANPLMAPQVNAATELWATYLPAYSECETALAGLNADLPGFGFSATLAKACAVNTLYNAGVKSANMIALVNHVVAVMASAPPPTWETVDSIALAPSLPYHKAFASKFVHFFVAPYGNVPMNDKWSRDRLKHHFHPDATGDYYEPNPTEFYADASALRLSVTPVPSWPDLDHYLWLAGRCAAGAGPDLPPGAGAWLTDLLGP